MAKKKNHLARAAQRILPRGVFKAIVKEGQNKSRKARKKRR